MAVVKEQVGDLVLYTVSTVNGLRGTAFADVTTTVGDVAPPGVDASLLATPATAQAGVQRFEWRDPSSPVPGPPNGVWLPIGIPVVPAKGKGALDFAQAFADVEVSKLAAKAAHKAEKDTDKASKATS